MAVSRRRRMSHACRCLGPSQAEHGSHTHTKICTPSGALYPVSPASDETSITMRILLTTTSFQDTPGPHHQMLKDSGFEVVTARGPLTEAQVLELIQKH